jgi:K+/H+ antiporter YhaU regulatory subunit KhtT
MREVRLPPVSVWAGHVLEEIRLRERFATTVLAVTRAGRGYFNPGPEFRLFPGDRLVLAGDRSGLERAVEFLMQREEHAGDDDEFVMEEVSVRERPEWVGRTLADLELPRRFGVTVIAVATGDRPPAPADPRQPLRLNDRLIIGAARDAFERWRRASSSEWTRDDVDAAGLVREGPGRGGSDLP